MCKRNVIILLTIILVIVLGAGIGVLTWWLVAGRYPYTVVELSGDGIGDIEQTVALTRIRGSGDMFWWFYPTTAASPTTKPLLLWLDGVTGLPPSLLANFGMFGPYDFNLNRRENSWVDEYNLLFVDAPLGTGFSTAQGANSIPSNVDENAQHLLYTLESFYELHREYSNAPLYICGEGHGAQLALSLATLLNDDNSVPHNLTGVIIGNGIISPALVLTKLGMYLEEMGYIDGRGRDAVENISKEINDSLDSFQMLEAFNLFRSLGRFINEEAGAEAVNLGHIVEKLTREPVEDYIDDFGKKKYLEAMSGSSELFSFMDDTVAPAVGISGVAYEQQRNDVLNAFGTSFMVPATDKVENILQNTNIRVTIYNGNLDAVSNTPGQLEWVDNLEWSGQAQFRNNTRTTLIINRQIEGYFRETERLQFYWINVAGQSAPLDNPVAIRRVLERLTSA